MNGAWVDVHGAGAQRSDPKSGNPADYPTGRGPAGRRHPHRQLRPPGALRHWDESSGDRDRDGNADPHARGDEHGHTACRADGHTDPTRPAAPPPSGAG